MKTKFNLLLLAVSISVVSCQSPSSFGNKGVKDTTSVTDTVSLPIAKEYVSNYKDHAGYVVDSTVTDSLGNVLRKPNTRCIWFSAKHLEKILAQLKAQKGDGVRFYLMTYNKNYPPSDEQHKPFPPRKYWGYNSLLMVSTKDSTVNGITYHQDFYKDRHHKTNQEGFVMNVNPENRGELCPPPQNCGKTGATLITN